ncbi:HEPN domain-containing protein [Archangium sp.]|uniref:HEPN domain-containing protein n=1 Tax=Archangium sp. TaxID=1872627 RepID=UPI002D605F53|nr:HEPN domain-containing protein [Archangium sp.]HYO58243.1 HEPN domain-containing protein [Archangium sp.]
MKKKETPKESTKTAKPKEAKAKPKEAKPKEAKKVERSSRDYLDIARRHLKRVQESWEEPDWSDLAMYGLYCLEAAILAAATHLSWTIKKTHWEKESLAERLHNDHELEDVSDLLPMLNAARKAHAYGDIDFDESDWDAEDVATRIENFIDEIEALIEEDDSAEDDDA